MEKDRKRKLIRNMSIIGALVLLALALLLISKNIRPEIGPETHVEVLPTEQPAEQKPEEDNQNVSAGYVLCRLPACGQVGLLPLPVSGEESYPIRQKMADGHETENILHVTPEGFWMEASNCENQDCVHQGDVTFENRETRILMNCVVCLPNQVTAELYTKEEIDQMLRNVNREGE